MKKVFFICTVAILIASLMPWSMPVSAADSTPGAAIMTFTFNAGEYTIAKDASGRDVIKMSDFSPAISPGDPMLPHKVYNILLPPDIIWPTLKFNVVSAQTSVLDGTYDIKPSPPLLPADDSSDVKPVEFWGQGKNIVDGRNMEVYGKDANFPDNYIRNLPYSQMGKWEFTKFDFTPFQYNPVLKKLTLVRSLTVEVSYAQSGIQPQVNLMAGSAMDDVAPQLFFNYSQGSGLYQAESGVAPQQAQYNYVIITTNAIQSNSTKLASFVAHKRSQGLSVLVVTETQWGAVTGQSPNHRAEKIRNWLINNYSNYGIQNILLIGNPSPYESGEGDVPMKMCWPDRTGSYPDTPTDHFYADLTGNWDLDGDGYYGECADDMGPGGVDIAPEVIVGRIPVYGTNYASLDSILQKIIDYENETDIAWRKNALLPMSYSDVYTDGAYLSEQMKANYLNADGFSTWRMYQEGTDVCSYATNSIYDCEQELRAGTVVRDRWAADDYGVVSWWGHGNYNIAVTCAGNLFSTPDSSALDDDHPSFTYQCSCLNGQPEYSSNLQYAILKQGGIGTMSATRVSWYYVGQTNFIHSPSNAGIGYEYVRRLAAGEAAGPAIYATMQSVNIDLRSYPFAMNCLGFNLYGDPTTSLASRSITVPLSITTTSLPAGINGGSYSQPLQAIGGTGSYFWSIVSGSLPAGLTLNSSTGIISGTPTVNATYDFTAQVSDGIATLSQDFSITISTAPLSITTESLPWGTINIPYVATLQAAGGIGGYIWSLSAGALPAGLTLDSSTGTIQGTPTTLGTSNFTAQVTSGSETITKDLTINIYMPAQLLLGAGPACDGSASNLLNLFCLVRFQATTTGNMTRFKINTLNTGSIKMAIYADASGEPGALINAVNTSTPVVGTPEQWLINDISFPSTPVTAGSYYWLAFNTYSAPSTVFIKGTWQTPGQCRYRAADYNGFTFPDNAGGGFTAVTDMFWCVSGWGPPAPITPPVVTNYNGASNITMDSARLYGEVTDTGNEDPQTYLYFGTTDGGTTPSNWQQGRTWGNRSKGTFYADVNNFTPNTDYYYRCYVYNSGGSSWAASTSHFKTLFGQKLVGADDAVITGPAGASYMVLGRFIASASSTVSRFKIKCSGPGYVRVAIYTDSSGEPGSLVNAVYDGTAVTAGWNTVSFPATNVISGTPYWLAFNSREPIVGYAGLTGTTRFKAATYSDFYFPSLAGTGFTPSAANLLLAGWGPPPPLSITTTSLPDGSVGVAYSQTLQAIGGSGSYTWSLTSGALPDGLLLTASTGVIAGTPTTAATSSFTVQVNDGSTTASQPLSINVTNDQKLLGSDDAAVVGPVGNNYLVLDRWAAVATGNASKVRVKCTTSGNVKVALYTDNAGSPGTLLNANNTGAAVVAGWNNISLPITAVTMGTNYWIAYNSSTNCVGYFSSPGGGLIFSPLAYSTDFPASAGTGFTTSSGNHSLTAGWGTSGPPPLSVTTTSLPDGAVGVAYSQTLQATGGSGSYTWSLTSGALPDGLLLTASTGVIAGTPTTTGTSNFTVQVNDGSTTATKPLSIAITVPMQKLLGADDAAAVGPAGGNFLVLDKSAAAATGPVTQIRVKCTTSGNVKVALYTDNGGSPGTLLNANNSGAAVTAGWNNITIPSTAVTAGTNYWIAYISTTNCVGYFSSPGGGLVFRALTYSTDFPASAGTGFTTSSGNHSLTAGWGEYTPPTLPVPPSLLSPGTAITFKWGAPSGATTYWLQVNTASDFTGTNLFNAEVGNITTQEVTGLSLGTSYYWRVKAGNSAGWSAWTAVRSVASTLVP